MFRCQTKRNYPITVDPSGILFRIAKRKLSLDKLINLAKVSQVSKIMLKALFFAVLALGLGAAYLLTTGHAEPLPQGAKAPTDAVSDQDGKPFDLAAAYQKGLTLVYFYPKADTPGCTKQACSLRDENKAITDAGIQILGVSINTPKEQKDFKEKYKLPFTLLADEEGKIVAGFGVPKMVIGFAKRQSFLVKNGLIVWSDPDVSPATHTAKVLEAAAKLKSA